MPRDGVVPRLRRHTGRYILAAAHEAHMDSQDTALDQAPRGAGAIALAAQVIFANLADPQVWRRFGKPLDRQNTATL